MQVNVKMKGPQAAADFLAGSIAAPGQGCLFWKCWSPALQTAGEEQPLTQASDFLNAENISWI